MKPNSIKALSIRISLSGLSFCILNRSTNTIEVLKEISLDKKATPFELLNELKKVLESDANFNQVFDSILCIYQNELSCLVPKPLFDENHLADYLKFNAKILKTDYITYDALAIHDSVNVYVPLVNINNYIFDTFGSFDYKHASTILIETLLQRTLDTADEQMYINVNTSTFEIVCTQKSTLIFYNTFEYNTKEDFIYYILFTLEQLKWDPETVHVWLSGTIKKEDTYYAILYKYIRCVDFITSTHNYTIASKLDHNASHNNFIILNSFN